MELYVVKFERVLCLDWWVGITKWMRFLLPCGFWQAHHLSEEIGSSRTKASIMIISWYYCKIDVFLLPLRRPSFLMTLLSLLVHSSSVNISLHVLTYQMSQIMEFSWNCNYNTIIISFFLHIIHILLLLFPHPFTIIHSYFHRLISNRKKYYQMKFLEIQASGIIYITRSVFQTYRPHSSFRYLIDWLKCSIWCIIIINTITTGVNEKECKEQIDIRVHQPTSNYT